jgi:hypothetical protein
MQRGAGSLSTAATRGRSSGEQWPPDRPTSRTIRRRWGWQELMSAAGGESVPAPRSSLRAARRAELLSALRQAQEELGRWPTAVEWEYATADHASRRTYVRWFGSWAAAIEAAAGYAYRGRSACGSSR